MNDKIDIAKICIFLIITIVFIFLTGLLNLLSSFSDSITISRYEEFCESKGYDFYEKIHRFHIACYDEVPIGEGGYERIYSKTYSIDDYRGERQWIRLFLSCQFWC